MPPRRQIVTMDSDFDSSDIEDQASSINKAPAVTVPAMDHAPARLEKRATLLSSLPSQNADCDTLSILIATDNHLGYAEKDPIRGEDSLNTFEEILQLAQEHEVDMILLAGDLFHDNKPSRKTLHRTLTLLRKYCLGDRPCPLEPLSDPSINFSRGFNVINYQDPNINIAMPVFSIHGNHDDPTGDGSLCALDLLSTVAYVNYFGRAEDVDQITLHPILLRKGSTYLALYGLGSVRDERLYRSFEQGHVTLMRPEVNESVSWFNMLTLHQNRAARAAHSGTNYIPEKFLDASLDLVIWGHEHECLIDPYYSTENDFHIIQPGSSVATSLSEGETKRKHVGILRIRGTHYALEKLPLKSVRPFVMQSVQLDAVPGLKLHDNQKVFQFLKERVENLIQQAKRQWCEERNLPENDASCPLPLIRLRVEYNDDTFSVFNPQRFGQHFVSLIANPKDVLLFSRRKTNNNNTNNATFAGNQGMDEVDLEDFNLPDKFEALRVEDLVTEYLSAQQLAALPENALNDAVKMFVDKDEKDAIDQFFTATLNSVVAQVAKRYQSTTATTTPPSLTADNVVHQITQVKKEQEVEYEAKYPNGSRLLQQQARVKDKNEKMNIDKDEENEDSIVLDEDDEEPLAPPPSTRGRGRGRGRASSSVPAKRKASNSLTQSTLNLVPASSKRNK